MKILHRCLLACSLLVTLTWQSSAQSGPYGNEWIDYSKIYYKFKVANQGVYRINRSLLDAQGLPSTVLGSNFKLYRDGVEVPVYVSAETMTGTDYIEFVGRAADGLLDKELYAVAAWQPDTRITYFTDTAAYYLTYDNTGGHQRYTTVNNSIPVTPPAAELYNWNTVGKYFKDAYTEGPAYDGFTGVSPNTGNPFFSPSFENGEGLVAGLIGAANATSVSLSTPNMVSGINAVLNSSVTTRSFDNAYTAASVRSIALTVNANTALATNSLGTAVTSHFSGLTVPAAQLSASGTNTFGYKITSSQVPYPYDVYGVSYTELKYARNFDMTGLTSYQFSLSPSASAQYLEFTNFAGTARLYDVTNKKMYAGDVNAGITRFYIDPSATERTLVIDEVNSGSVALGLSKKFTFTNHAATQADYLIVTHSKLDEATGGHNYVTEYKDYRTSAAGGSHIVHVADVTELYDEFGYGYETHPLGIRHYFQYAYANWSLKPTAINIIGKGLQYDQYKAYYSNPATYQFPIVPVFGNPGSDVNFVNFGTPRKQKIEIGRVPVWNNVELGKYLTKVKEYEGAINTGSDATSLWKKNVLHLAGGVTESEGISFASTLAAGLPYITDTVLGAKVFTSVKNGVTPVSLAARLKIDTMLRGGVSMITYFGHASEVALNYTLPEPDSFHANPRFPIFVALGCDVASVFKATTVRTFSEQYVFATTGGAAAVLATDNYGYTGFLDQYLIEYYKSIGRSADFGASVGKHSMVANNAVFDFYATGGTLSPYYFTQIESQILTGDPALPVFGPAKPDYEVGVSGLSTSPDKVGINADSFSLKIVTTNLGKSLRDTVTVRIQHENPANQLMDVQTYKVLNLFYSDTTTIKVPIDKLRDRGLNKYYVTVDAPNKFAEVDETNNQAVIQKFIYSQSLVPVYPYEFAIVNTPTVVLKASTMNPFETAANYKIEIDTTTAFNSPLKLQTSVASTGGVVRWTPPMTLVDSTVYYWRTAMDSSVNGEIQWNTSSFVYLASGTPGWNQSHFYQYKKDDFSSMSFGTDRQLKYDKAENFLTANNYYITTEQENDYSTILYNGQIVQKSIQNIVSGGATQLQIMVIDSVSGKIFKNTASSTYGALPPTSFTSGTNIRQFTMSTKAQRQVVKDFLQGLPNNSYILIRNLCYDYLGVVVTQNVPVSVWQADTVGEVPGNTLYETFKSLGFTYIDSFTSIRPFLMLGKKGDPNYPIKQRITRRGQLITIDTAVVGYGANGQMLGTVVGPATNWQSLLWRRSAPDGFPQNDSADVTIYGITASGAETQLYKIADRNFSLSGINAATYPKLRLVWNTLDSLSSTPPKLDYWRVLYAPVADIALNPNIHMVFPDTVTIGVPSLVAPSQTVSIAIENLSNVPMDSVLVNYRLIDASGGTVQLANKRYRPLAGLDTLHADYSFVPNGYVGNNYFVAQANPNNDHPENNTGNNIGFKAFTVTSPLPLTLLSFTGNLVGNDAVLDWKTTNEQNVSYYELERSYDANIFSAINKTAASNKLGDHAYSHTDKEWAKHANSGYVYYRLKMVDNSGKYTRSNMVKFAVNKDELLIVNAYPNPATSLLNLQIQTPGADDYTLKVVDVAGKLVYNNIYRLDAGMQRISVPVNQLSAGIYLLTVNSSDGTPQQFKFVKQ